MLFGCLCMLTGNFTWQSAERAKNTKRKIFHYFWGKMFFFYNYQYKNCLEKNYK